MEIIKVRNRELLMQKLKELNFCGPVFISGHQFMIYHGQRLAIPSNTDFTIMQFRFLLQEVESMVSGEEWNH